MDFHWHTASPGVSPDDVKFAEAVCLRASAGRVLARRVTLWTGDTSILWQFPNGTTRVGPLKSNAQEALVAACETLAAYLGWDIARPA